MKETHKVRKKEGVAFGTIEKLMATLQVMFVRENGPQKEKKCADGETPSQRRDNQGRIFFTRCAIYFVMQSGKAEEPRVIVCDILFRWVVMIKNRWPPCNRWFHLHEMRFLPNMMARKIFVWRFGKIRKLQIRSKLSILEQFVETHVRLLSTPHYWPRCRRIRLPAWSHGRRPFHETCPPLTLWFLASQGKVVNHLIWGSTIPNPAWKFVL